MATTPATPKPQEKTLDQIHLDAAIADLTSQLTEYSNKRAMLAGEIAKRDTVIRQLSTENEALRKQIAEPEPVPPKKQA